METLQSCYIDQDIVRREIIQHISFSLGTEPKEARNGHSQTHEQRNPCRIVGNHSEAIHRRLFKRAVDKKAVVICQKVSTLYGCMVLEGYSGVTYGRRTLFKDQVSKGLFASKCRCWSVIESLPNEMTPAAWKKPELTQSNPFTSPRDSGGTRNTWVITATRITTILTNARVDALPSY